MGSPKHLPSNKNMAVGIAVHLGVFSSLLKGLREEVFASHGGLCDSKLLRSVTKVQHMVLCLIHN